MKYVLYRFPDVVAEPKIDKDGMIDDTFRLKKGVKKRDIKPEVVAVEFGPDICSVADELGRAVLDELTDTPEYKLHKCDFGEPETPDEVNKLAKGYNYQMVGIVQNPYSDSNTIIYFGVKEAEE